MAWWMRSSSRSIENRMRRARSMTNATRLQVVVVLPFVAGSRTWSERDMDLVASETVGEELINFN